MRPNSACFLAIFCIILVSVTDDTESFTGGFLNVRYKPVTRNVDSKNTKTCSASKPLYLFAEASAITILINTGQSIQTNNQRGDVAYVTGGPLGDVKYNYLSYTYYWASNATTGVTGTTIDDNGFPYGVRVFYINEKYTTFAEALRHKDGFADLVYLFKICSTPFKPFNEISEQIQKLAKAGSSTPVPLGTHTKSVNFLTQKNSYYAYTGKFLDTYRNKTYASSTVIIFKLNAKACITQGQFNKTFEYLVNYSGKPLYNTLTHDSSELQSSLCSGVIQKVKP